MASRGGESSARLVEGVALRKSGRLGEAKAAFREVAGGARGAEDAEARREAWGELRECLRVELGGLERSLAEAEGARASGDDYGRLGDAFGALALECGATDGAEKEAAAALHGGGVCQSRAGRWAQAQGLLGRALAYRGGDDALLLHGLGECAHELGDFGGAAEAYRSCLASLDRVGRGARGGGPDDLEFAARRGLVESLVAGGDRGAAEAGDAWVDAAKRMRYDAGDALYWAGTARLRVMDVDGAAARLLESVTAYGGGPLAKSAAVSLLTCGEHLLVEGRGGVAVRMLWAVLNFVDRRPELFRDEPLMRGGIALNLACGYGSFGKWRKAAEVLRAQIDDCEKVQKKGKCRDRIYLALGVARMRLGDHVGARWALEAGLKVGKATPTGYAPVPELWHARPVKAFRPWSQSDATCLHDLGVACYLTGALYCARDALRAAQLADPSDADNVEALRRVMAVVDAREAADRAAKGCDIGQLQRLLSRSSSTRFG